MHCALLLTLALGTAPVDPRPAPPAAARPDPSCAAEVDEALETEAKLAAMARRTRCWLRAGNLDAARASLADERRTADREGADGYGLWARLATGWVEVEHGSPAAAEAQVRDMLARLPGARLPPERRDHMRVAALTMRVQALAGAHDFATARQLAAEVRAMAERRKSEGELLVLETVLLRAETDAADLDAAKRHARNAPDEWIVAWYYTALLRERTGDARGAADLYARIASHDEDDFFTALVRGHSRFRDAR